MDDVRFELRGVRCGLPTNRTISADTGIDWAEDEIEIVHAR